MAFIRASGLALLLAGAANGEDAGFVKLRRTCSNLLMDISTTPYSNEELSMMCRSRVPGEICRDSLHMLGEKPWAPQRIAVACERWERDFDMRTLEMAPERRAMSLEDLQSTMDKIMQSKNAVGVCKGESVDQCAARKKDEYPKYTQQMTDTLTQKSSKLKESYDNWMGTSSGAAQDAMEKVKSATKDMAGSVTDAAADATDKATSAATDATEKATYAVTHATDKAKSTADKATSAVTEATDKATSAATEATDKATSAATEATDKATTAATEATDKATSAASDSAKSLADKLGGKVELQEEAVVPPASTSSRLAALGAGLIAASLALVGAFAVVDRIQILRRHSHVRELAQEQDMLEGAGQ